ncbi:MAG: PEP-CTERM sorting domain-containing protein [Halioglobus sp.]|nr:PEP-CTERM sorting domain-containing protein [Halioglobus sp.]
MTRFANLLKNTCAPLLGLGLVGVGCFARRRRAQR